MNCASHIWAWRYCPVGSTSDLGGLWLNSGLQVRDLWDTGECTCPRWTCRWTEQNSPYNSDKDFEYSQQCASWRLSSWGFEVVPVHSPGEIKHKHYHPSHRKPLEFCSYRRCCSSHFDVPTLAVKGVPVIVLFIDMSYLQHPLNDKYELAARLI